MVCYSAHCEQSLKGLRSLCASCSLMLQYILNILVFVKLGTLIIL